jgi:very-short-patch-repair endonuclease
VSLKQLSRRLRRDSTDAERLLWRSIRDRGLHGFKFRRQWAIGEWILDFYCPAANLAIEVDGGGHADPEMLWRDRQRTRELTRKGIRVLRF